MSSFPNGTNLETELRKAMDRLQTLGVVYTDGYYEKILEKWTAKGVPYPRILMRVGDPLIRKHPKYDELKGRHGRLLDYGCGMGDDVRALILDGHPKESLIGFDINSITKIPILPPLMAE